jgi:hypothetical protein
LYLLRAGFALFLALVRRWDVSMSAQAAPIAVVGVKDGHSG